eukprot:TRINITY_DN28698_c0_g2_i1.p1 TRINITY_DN28698_c0_g2~~TRINITY_DN28698_c0_g2_i1.p1  ORF type:complete len:1064 (+),score=233.60 TRINITY_DN28698_c0_g2_i1:80-3271(+)
MVLHPKDLETPSPLLSLTRGTVVPKALPRSSSQCTPTPPWNDMRTNPKESRRLGRSKSIDLMAGSRQRDGETSPCQAAKKSHLRRRIYLARSDAEAQRGPAQKHSAAKNTLPLRLACQEDSSTLLRKTAASTPSVDSAMLGKKKVACSSPTPSLPLCTAEEAESVCSEASIQKPSIHRHSGLVVMTLWKQKWALVSFNDDPLWKKHQRIDRLLSDDNYKASKAKKKNTKKARVRSSSRPRGSSADWSQAVLAAVPTKHDVLELDMQEAEENAKRISAEAAARESRTRADRRATTRASMVAMCNDIKNLKSEAERAKLSLDAVEQDHAEVDMDKMLYRIKRDPGLDGFDWDEIGNFNSAFDRFKAPGSVDVKVQRLPQILTTLGYRFVEETAVQKIISSLTTCEYITFDEFVVFMTYYLPYEFQEYNKLFRKFDQDGSGEISVAELRAACLELGYTPNRELLFDILRTIDRDNNGVLDFDEMILFLAIYRHYEGFTKADLRGLREVHVRHGSEVHNRPPKLMPYRLQTALVDHFGAQVREISQRLEEELLTVNALTDKEYEELGLQRPEPEPLSFPEFLVLARRCREVLYEQEFREQTETFERYDTDGSGAMGYDELVDVLKEHKIFPLKILIEEICTEVCEDYEEGYELEFQEFFDFLSILKQRHGFLRAEVDNFRAIFNKFDVDSTGEIKCLELLEVWRCLGYSVQFSVLHGYLSEVDEQKRGRLAFPAFMHVMRLHRQAELQRISDVYDAKMTEATQSLAVRAAECRVETAGRRRALALGESLRSLMNEGLHYEAVVDALRELGYPDMEKLVPHDTPVDLDALVALVDSCRQDNLDNSRKTAGFTTAETFQFKNLFQEHDQRKSGKIGHSTLLDILQELKLTPRHKIDREKWGEELLQLIDEARELAVEAHGDSEDIIRDGQCIDFYTFLQLARLIQAQLDKKEQARIEALCKELRFSALDCDGFKQIFMQWVGLAFDGDETEVPHESLKMDVLTEPKIIRLIRFLDISLMGRCRDDLTKFLNGVMSPTRTLDFAGFLKLMRWMEDTDFGGVASNRKNANR